MRSCSCPSNHLLLPPCLSSLKPLPWRIQFIFHSPLSLVLPKTVCIGPLNQVLAVNLSCTVMKILPVRDGPSKGNEYNAFRPVGCFGNPHFVFNNKQPPVSALSGCQWLTVGQGSAACNGPVLFIAPYGLRSLGFNESPLVLAGQKSLSVCAPVRWCEEERERERDIHNCFSSLSLSLSAHML